jgi:hypothetical protein
MAVAIISKLPEGAGVAEYDAVNAKLDPSMPPGSIFHCSGEVDGRFQVFDVWESRGDYDRFVEERLIPAMKQAMGEEVYSQLPDADITEIELHDYQAS